MVDEEKLNRFVAIRGGNRGVVTKLVRESHELLKREQIDFQRLEVIERQLDVKSKALEELDQSILEICPVEIVPKEIEEAEEIIARVIDCKTRIHAERQRVNPTQHIERNNNANPPQATTTTLKPKLPKIELPKFGGDVTTWFSF